MADLKLIARRIFAETLAAIDVPSAVERELELHHGKLRCRHLVFDLREVREAKVVCVGKAAHGMAEGLARVLLPEVKFTGVVSAPTKPEKPIAGLTYFAGGHPVPNEQSWNAAKAILTLLESCSEQSLVIFLLSGGGSALMEFSLDPAKSLEDLQALHRVLVGCGASIEEINTIRKHISAVKGGRLAAAAGRARKLTLAISDVPVGKESALASGPTLPDPTTCEDVLLLLDKYRLRGKLPRSIRDWIALGKMRETPKPGDPAFANAHFYLLLGMHELFHAAHQAAEAKGFFTCCDNSTDDWPVEQAANALLDALEELRRNNPGAPVALIADGEVSSPVTGDGVGGRNSAFVLACVERIAGTGIAVLSAGTDGIDGNSTAAGAVADGETLQRAEASGMKPREYFRNSDAGTFFKKLGDGVETGPTGNNLRDLRILLAAR
jgi:hydroxypyruvate reductase